MDDLPGALVTIAIIAAIVIMWLAEKGFIFTSTPC